MEQIVTTDELTTSETTAAGDPEWRYVPVRRTSMDSGEGGGGVAMEELVLQTEGDIAGNFRDTAEGEPADADIDTLVFTGLASDGEATARYDDDGDLDLYVVNSPGGDNALFEQSTPKLQEKILTGEFGPAGDGGMPVEAGLGTTESFELV